MRGKLLTKAELIEHYDGKIVYVEFEINAHSLRCSEEHLRDMELYKETKESFERCLKKVRKQFYDGLFRFALRKNPEEHLGAIWTGGNLTRLESEEDSFYAGHNLIGNIYEWVE